MMEVLARMSPPRPALAPLLLLSLAVVGLGAVAVPEARARAGVAGGAGGAELAELAEKQVANSSLSHLTAPLEEAPGGGTIREALGGGVVEPEQLPASTTGSTRTRSRCISPQVCLRVDQCPPSPGEDLLFECAAGRACCVPTPPPTPHPHPPRPPVSTPSRPGQQGGHPVATGDRVSTPNPPRPTTAKPTSAPPSLLPDIETCGRVLTENRITNGKTASLGQFPWMALLGYNRRGSANVTFLCGGTLINERYVLTAAHCISTQNRPVVVRLGEFNLTKAVDCDHNNVCAPPPEDIPVEHVILHPDFDIRNIKHDIALLRLRRSVSEYSDFVRPICMPIGINVTDEKKFKIAGWGKTDFKEAGGSVALQFTDVSGVGHAECNELQPPELQPLDPGQLCAGGDKGKDACKGDSGGPLMVTLINNPAGDLPPSHVTYQIGVVSYGPDSPCGTAPLPSIYTRVASYVPWIISSLRP